MKFTSALISLLALPAVEAVVLGMPEGLVEQCCIVTEETTVPPSTWLDEVTTCDGISGILAGTCNGQTGDLAPLCGSFAAINEMAGANMNCMTPLQTCYSKFPGVPIEKVIANIVVCDDEYNCCDISDPENPEVVADVPWTCANEMIDGYMDDIQTEFGFYCGPEDECKVSFVFCGGDPHFKTWNGEWYDFHGECDLQYLEDKEFGQGLGLDIQIRTKARYEYSFIESAAIKIGDDVLEVGAYGQYFLNGVENADMKHAQIGGVMDLVHEVSDDQKSHMFTIFTGKTRGGLEETIKVKSFKDLVSVSIDNAFGTSFGQSVGMMGNFHSGARLGRDGKTVISDDIEMGMEWQVVADAPELFQVSKDRSQKCVMPSKNASAERRRLGETISEEAAEAACAAVDHVHHDNCVYDVMATGDLESAHAGVF